MRWKRTEKTGFGLRASGVGLGAVIAAACGGAPKPAPVVASAPPPRQTRVVVEDREPDEGAQVTHVRGHIEEPERKLSPLHGELSQCYTSRVGRRRWLGGRVKLHWDVAADGAIAKVVLAESDLGAWPIEKCLVDVARTATFGTPVGGNADVMLPLEFTPPDPVDAWDDERVDKAIGKQLVKLDACGKAEPPPDDVTITVYVGWRGKAQSVGFASATSEIAEPWAECVQKAVMAWRLPDPKGVIAKLAIHYRGK